MGRIEELSMWGENAVSLITMMTKVVSFLAVIAALLAGCTGGTAPAPTPAATATPVAATATAVAAATTVAAATPVASAITPAATETFSPQEQTMIDALIAAAEAGDVESIRALLAQGADINGRDTGGRTPVMAATHGRQVEAVRALLQAGADVDIRDNRLDNPFLYAGAEGLLEILRLAIDAGADPHLTNRFGGTALIPAAERGHVAVVTELLTRTDVDVNHVNNLGWTALLEAVLLGDGGERHQQIVRILVEHGANVRIADHDGVTPLQHAQARGFTEIEGFLMETQQELDRGLIAAAHQGDSALLRSLLARGASVDTQDERGVTALIAAAYRNDLEAADLLISAGADVNVQDRTRQSAYLISTSEGYLELLRRTLQAGADVHSKDSYNGTGLIRAADRGHVEIIRALLQTDIDIDHVNNLGWTALLEAIILGDGSERYQEVVRLLVDAGADVNLADAGGVTPLQHARSRAYTAIQNILVQAGAR
jgi:ankyrin repeat protein